MLQQKLAPKDSNLDKQIQSLVPDDHAATGNDQYVTDAVSSTAAPWSLVVAP